MVLLSPNNIDGISISTTYDGLSVMITWDPVTDREVEGYNVYRGIVPIGTSYDYYAKINSNVITGLTYFDDPLSKSRFGADVNTFYYKVAFHDGLTESVLSSPYAWDDYDAFSRYPSLPASFDEVL